MKTSYKQNVQWKYLHPEICFMLALRRGLTFLSLILVGITNSQGQTFDATNSSTFSNGATYLSNSSQNTSGVTSEITLDSNALTLHYDSINIASAAPYDIDTTFIPAVPPVYTPILSGFNQLTYVLTTPGVPAYTSSLTFNPFTNLSFSEQAGVNQALTYLGGAPNSVFSIAPSILTFELPLTLTGAYTVQGPTQTVTGTFSIPVASETLQVEGTCTQAITLIP